MTDNNFLFRGKNLAGIIFLILAGVVAYSNSFSVPFVLDDIRSIVDNHFIKSFQGFSGLEIFSKNRPLVDFSFALNYYFGGLEVFGYHLVNLLVHISSGIMVYWLLLLISSHLCKISGDYHSSSVDFRLLRFISLFAALIFIVHPLQTQAVTYIVQRYTSLSAFFYLLSVICYILGRNSLISERSNASAYALLLACFVSGIMAFLCKQSAASLPGAILLVEFIMYDKSWSAWKKKLYWIAPLSCMFVLFVFYNAGYFSGHREFGSLLGDMSALARTTTDISRWEYLLTQFCVVPKYLFMYLVPVGQNIDHMHPVIKSIWNGCAFGGLLLILSLLTGACFLFRRQPVISLAIFWFFVAISVESSIIPIDDPMFEHRMYLPMVGPALTTAWIAGLMFQKYPRTFLSLSLCVVVVLGFLTFERNKTWQSQVTIWEDSITKNPGNFRAHTSLALALESDNNVQKAINHYNKALQLNPDYAFAHLNYGSLLGERGQVKQAEFHFRRAMQEMPDNPRVLSNLGVALATQGELEEALVLFRQAISIDPNTVDARINLVITLLNLRKIDQAREEAEIILELNPENDQAGELMNRINNIM